MKTLNLIFMLLIMSLPAMAFELDSASPIVYNEGQKLWLITGIIGNNYDTFISTIVESEDVSDDGFSAINDLKIQINAEDFFCTYQYRTQGQIFFYQISEADRAWFDDATEKCIEKYSDTVRGFATSLYSPSYCIRRSAIGNYGNFLQATPDFTASIMMTAGGKTTNEGTLSNNAEPVILYHSGNQVAEIEYLGGGLKTQNSCPEAATLDRAAVRNTKAATGIIAVDQGLINDWDRLSYNDIQDDIDKIGSGDSSGYNLPTYDREIGLLYTRMNNYVSELNDYFIPTRYYTYFTDNTGTDRQFTQEERGVRIDLGTQAVLLPKIKMLVAADFIGVTELSGKPEIISPSSKQELDFKESDQFYIDFTVRNIGTQSGTFIARLDCEDETTVWSVQQINLGSVDPEKTKSGRMRVLGDTATEDVVACDLIVYDKNDPSNRDSLAYVFEVAASEDCPWETPVCLTNAQLGYCEENVAKFDDCPNGCIQDATGGRCAELDDACEVDSDCEEKSGFVAKCMSGSKGNYCNYQESGIGSIAWGRVALSFIIALIFGIYLFITLAVPIGGRNAGIVSGVAGIISFILLLLITRWIADTFRFLLL